MMRSYRLIFMSVLAVMALGQAGSAVAQSQMGAVPQFLPTGGWQVQETVLSQVRGLQGIDLPCVMVSGYDNGYSLRISGSGQKILAMAIDFRQDVFTQGHKYSAKLSVSDKYNRTIKGTAFSESTLIFNMRNYDGFYSALSKAVKMKLDIEDNPMVFSLGSIEKGLEKLNSCSGGESVSPAIKQVSLPSKAVDIPRGPVSDKQSLDDGSVSWDNKVTPVPARVSRSVEKTRVARGALWAANAGDDMEATLKGWAKRAGVRLDWKATGEQKVPDNVRVYGTFEDAVQALMAQKSAVGGLDANMMSGSMGNIASGRGKSAVGMPQPIIPNHMVRSSAISPSVSTSVSAVGGNASGSRWDALMGASLKQVLQQWSKKAGVELVWESNQGFSVKRAIALGGSYETALQSLLNQYANDRIHPVANLNSDPITGKRILLIQSSRVL